jgi:hypothetical protein
MDVKNMRIVFSLLVIALFSYKVLEPDDEAQWVTFARIILIIANLVFVYTEIRKRMKKYKIEKQP